MKLVHHTAAEDRQTRARRRVLKTIAVLPSLATLGNLVCGLGAIYFCMLSAPADGSDSFGRLVGSTRFGGLFPTFPALAAYLLVVAMFFDSVDGRLARFTRKTSEFGGQLDSLADIVSFGVAPVMLVLCIARPTDLGALTTWGRLYWRAEWVMAAVFVCCAALRLARFNVENEEDESAHLGFRGLPSPGAAAALIGLVIFHQDLLPNLAHEHLAHKGTSRIIASLMTPYAMVLGLLMVSRFHYVHLVNTLLRGRRPFRQVVAIVILVLVGLIVQFQLTIALAAGVYAWSGPLAGLFRKISRRPRVEDEDLTQDVSESTAETETFAEADDDLFVDQDGDGSTRSVG